MKKRLISILLCGLLAATCIGCGEKEYTINVDSKTNVLEGTEEHEVFHKGDEVTVNQKSEDCTDSYKLKINHVKYLEDKDLYEIEYEYTNINMESGLYMEGLGNIVNENKYLSYSKGKDEDYAPKDVKIGETCTARVYYSVPDKDSKLLRIYYPYTKNLKAYFEIEIEK